VKSVSLIVARAMALALALACPRPALAQAEPEEATAEEPTLPYRTELAASGNAALDITLAAASQLRALQDSAPTEALGLVSRAAADIDRLQHAMESEGFWAGQIGITVAGQPPGAPNLAETLATAPQPVIVQVTAAPGPLYRLRRVEAQASTPEDQAVLDQAMTTPFGLAPGDAARAEAVLAAERSLLQRLLAAGYPLASLVRRQVTVDHASRSMDVVWTLAPGPFARFAVPEVAGTERMDPGFLARQAAPLAGQPYSPEALEKQRAALMGLGAFGSVRARAAERLDAAGRLPVTFTVAERPRRALGGSVAYETNYGPSVRAWWEHRNLFGGAERLRLEAEVARIGVGNAGDAGNMTYRLGGTLTDQGVLGWPGLTLQASSYYLRERLDAYDRDAITAAAIFQRPITPQLTLRAGPQLDFGAIGPPGGNQLPYQILGVLFGARWDTTDNLLNPTRGWRLDGTVAPSLSLANSAPFLPLRVTGTTYWDLFGDKGSVLAARGSFGSLLGSGRSSVPRHLRYYAGGGGSVRGYDYQSIGPRDARTKPDGGASIIEASLEWRQHVYGDFGAVAFVDMGNVSTGGLPGGQPRVGAGMGLRYFTPIGPIRADIALPLMKQQGSSGYGLYLGIGQAF
jgi:translocation and assembly module TamA